MEYEQGKVFLTNVDKRKEIIKQQFESRIRLILYNIKLLDEHIQNFKKQRENERIEKLLKIKRNGMKKNSDKRVERFSILQNIGAKE